MKSTKPKLAWKVALTDKFIQALKVRDGKARDQVQDIVVPKLYVRVTDRGAKSFAVAALLQGRSGKAGEAGKSTTHFITLGRYPTLSLSPRVRRRRQHSR